MKKKIVYIVGGIWNGSGMERVLTMKANYMADIYGYDVIILLTEDGKGIPYFHISDKIQIDNLHINFDELHTFPLIKRVWKYFIKQIKYKQKLREYLISIKADITVTAMRREINFIHSISDGSKKVGEMHFNKSNYRQFNATFLPEYINKRISGFWMRQLIIQIKKLSVFVVLSHEDRKEWTELEDVEVIHNPLSFYPSEQSDCESKKIIAAGRYTYQKGFDLLIKAWCIVSEKHKDWALCIYGNGNRKKYQEEIDKLGIANNCFAEQAVPNIIDKYLESSIFVLSSRYEGFGMVITEAMACGVPPVSFACPCGPRDIINDGEDGLLVENGNIEQLAEKICYLIENEDIHKEMGRKARINVERFKMENIAKQWDELFRKL